MIPRALAVLSALAWAGPSGAACRQALAIGLDVSGSVDAREYRLQIDGLAGALSSPQVRARLLDGPDAPVRLAVFEWSGPASQFLILPWTEIDGPAALDGAIARLLAARRQDAQLSTAIGAAMAAGAALLADQGDCWRRTLDLSGDGPSNTGPLPRIVRDRNLPAGMVVNGLVIADPAQAGDDRSADAGQLAAYYEAEVIAGLGAFVETAIGFEDFQAAMQRKLLRELASLALGSAR